MYHRSIVVGSMLLIALFIVTPGLARSIGRAEPHVKFTPQALDPQVYIPAIMKPKATPIPPSGACAENAPTFSDGAQVWVPQADIAAGTMGTLCVRLIRDDRSIPGASATAILYYPDRDTSLGPALTADDGVATIPFQTPKPAATGIVVVNATVVYQGSVFSAGTCFNIFSGPHVAILVCA